MVLDLTQLALLGLGSDGTSPRPDGVHLRWAFADELSFPADGFSLYRRGALKARYKCFDLQSLDGERLVSGQFDIGPFQLETREQLKVVYNFPSSGQIALQLSDRGAMRVNMPETARSVQLRFFGREGQIRLRGFAGAQLLAQKIVSRMTGVQDVEISALGLTHVIVEAQRLYLLRICYLTAEERIPDDPRRAGWHHLVDLNLPDSWAVGRPRVLANLAKIQGAYREWMALAIKTLIDPSNPVPRHERNLTYVEGGTTPIDPSVSTPGRARYNLNLQSLLLLAAFDPEFARFLGLCHVDQVPAGPSFDYLLIGRWLPKARLAIAYGLRREPAPSLAAPTGVNATTFRTAVSEKGQTGTSVGVRWSLPGSGAVSVATHGAVWYDVRAALAAPAEAPTAPTSVTFPSALANADGRIIVARRVDESGRPAYPAHYFMQLHRSYGWWAYGVKGFDLFGRESAWTGNAFARVLDQTPPPAPRVLVRIDDGSTVYLPVQARHLDISDPTLSTADRSLLASRSLSVATVVEWTWLDVQHDLAPDAHEFRVYFHAEFRSAQIDVTAVGPTTSNSVAVTLASAPPFDAVGGQLSVDGRAFQIESASGAVLTVRRIAVNERNGNSVRIDPITGSATITQPVTDGRVWSQRIHVEPVDSSHPARDYRAVISGALLAPTVSNPVISGWIGVTAADDKAYVPDDPARTGSLSGRAGNESEIAVRARITAVNRDTPAAPPAPTGSQYATRADFHGRSRYRVGLSVTSPQTYHIWRATESGVTSSDLRARRERPAGTYYATNDPFADDSGFSAWLSSAFPSLTAADLLATTPSSEAENAWAAWARRFYARDALSDDLLRQIADRDPNDRAFAQITRQPTGDSGYDDEFDGRVQGRYLYKTQGVYPNGAAGPLGPTAQPVRLHDVVPPRAPIINKIELADRQATIHWTPNTESDLDYYELYRASVEPNAIVDDTRLMELRQVALAASATSVADAPLTPGRSYAYVLVAVDTSGNRSTASVAREAHGIATSPPTPPTPTVARADDGVTVIVDWLPPEEGTRALIQRTVAGANAWNAVSTWLGVDDTSYEDTRATADSLEYRLQLMDAAGNISVPSAAASVS